MRCGNRGSVVLGRVDLAVPAVLVVRVGREVLLLPVVREALVVRVVVDGAVRVVRLVVGRLRMRSLRGVGLLRLGRLTGK